MTQGASVIVPSVCDAKASVRSLEYDTNTRFSMCMFGQEYVLMHLTNLCACQVSAHALLTRI